MSNFVALIQITRNDGYLATPLRLKLCASTASARLQIEGEDEEDKIIIPFFLKDLFKQSSVWHVGKSCKQFLTLKMNWNLFTQCRVYEV